MRAVPQVSQLKLRASYGLTRIFSSATASDLNAASTVV